jgi:hypothetical protein
MYTKGDKSVSIEEAQDSAAFSEIPVEELGRKLRLVS